MVALGRLGRARVSGNNLLNLQTIGYKGQDLEGKRVNLVKGRKVSIEGCEEGLFKQNTRGEHKEVLNYWFLLEEEHLEAITKGNHSLEGLARARINFLKSKLPRKLLLRGLDGEEALCEIRWILMNEGWWEKARNLDVTGLRVQSKSDSQLLLEESQTKQFITNYAKLVHPNVLKMVDKDEKEGFRMALNQIHYGTLQSSREVKELRSRVKVKVPTIEAQKVGIKVLVEDTVHHSDGEQENQRSTGTMNKSYKEALLSPKGE